jgi:hypothetical protein
MTGSITPSSSFNSFLHTVPGKIATVLGIIAIGLGVVGEAIIIYTNAQKAKIELETADNAKKLKAAEAARMQAEAEKIKAEAATANAVAENAMHRQKAEAEIAAQKAAIELEAARNAARLKHAEADKLQAEAQKATTLSNAITGRGTGSQADPRWGSNLWDLANCLNNSRDPQCKEVQRKFGPPR